LTIVDLRLEEEEFALRSLQKSTIVNRQSMCALPPDGSTQWCFTVQKSPPDFRKCRFDFLIETVAKMG
jgi:hypothetical protein